MCGRYTLTSTDGLVEEFRLIQEPFDFAPRYNIAPTQRVPVIHNRASDQPAVEIMRWGLIPIWAKDPAIGSRMINARGETVDKKPAFRKALRERRCIVPADGFYEWKRQGKSKLPFLIQRPSRKFLAFAGLWERWKAPDGDWLLSFSIITTEANDAMRPLHDRMPVILDPADYGRWLEPGELTRDALDTLLSPSPNDWLAMRQVSQLVGSVRNDSPACIAPVPEQRSLFD